MSTVYVATARFSARFGTNLCLVSCGFPSLMFARHWIIYFSELKILEPLEYKSWMKETHLYNHAPTFLPSEKSILSKGSSSWGGREEWTGPGCAVPLPALGPRTQHTCWCRAGSPPRTAAPWAAARRWTASRTCHCGWHSNTPGWCCSRQMAWC